MNNFIITGCSFSAGIISLPHDTANDWEDRGSVWSHFCFAKMNPSTDKFLNLAIPGGGNLASFMNLVYVLETNKGIVTPDNTLIGFNITGMNRYDVIGDPERDNINKDIACIDPEGISHPSEVLGFGWITKPNTNLKTCILSELVIITCLTYLESKKFNYFFMLMNDSIYTDSSFMFKQALDQRKSNWIIFDKTKGMAELAKKYNQLEPDGHPTITGHKRLSEFVLDWIRKKHKHYINE